jgi:transposase
MPTQLALIFDDVPITCPTQKRYHAIAGCLAGKASPREVAEQLNVGYSTVTEWVREFRNNGMGGLMESGTAGRNPYTPEKVIVQVIFLKTCLPKFGDRELARVVASLTGKALDHHTIRNLCRRFYFWGHAEFQKAISYPVPNDPIALRREILRFAKAGMTEVRIAQLLRLNRKTVRKWIRRWRETAADKVVRIDQPCLFDLSRAPKNPKRKVYIGAIHAVLQLQKKYGYAGWFRIQGYLLKDYGIELGKTAIKKIMALNRRLHLAPVRPVEVVEPEIREGPPKSVRAFEHVFIDLRYLDAKPEGVQLYSCLVLEGLSRTILAGSLTSAQDVSVVLQVYFQALMRWGLWEILVSDHGGQFLSNEFKRVHARLGIDHRPYPKGHPWQNLIESQFGIQARVGEYYWERCRSIAEAVEFHRQLIRDHNRLPHFAHRKRTDRRRTPLDVLGQRRGKEVSSAELNQAFSQKFWRRKTDEHGFVRVGRWKIYVEEGLPRSDVQLSYWDGTLRAERDGYPLVEYPAKWDRNAERPVNLGAPLPLVSPFNSRQMTLFDPEWIRLPVDLGPVEMKKRTIPKIHQPKFNFGT